MKKKIKIINRKLKKGLGEAVANRTILRDGEAWQDVAHRVASGNVSLLKGDEWKEHREEEFEKLNKYISTGMMLMSGRHLQHGDPTQPERNMEVFTNCLEKNTEILTLENGPVAIGTINGSTVTVKSRDGKWRPARVKSYGEQELYKISFGPINNVKSNIKTEVIATKNHRWFLDSGEVTTSLKVGDVLEPASIGVKEDSEGVRHGLIFGDGTAHKSRNDYGGKIVSQGRQYCSIRLCGKDKKYVKYFDGYSVSFPKHSNGDPVVYIGKKDWKDLPFTTDPEYIAGFIKGWWLADGSKTFPKQKGIEISTTSTEAVDWLKKYASFAGYIITGETVRSKNRVGAYKNGKTLYQIRLAQGKKRRVISIDPYGKDEVFCVEEPVTQGFVLANGLLTGNCATASATYILFYLLLNGSGVGRAYDDDMMLVNWDYMPIIRCVLDESHPDFEWGVDESTKEARHKYNKVFWFEVPDTREGWAQAIEKIEVMAFEKIYKDNVLVLDFSKVREKGKPIGGMQNRPASGPKPLMQAINRLASVKNTGMPTWKQTMYADHYLAECVLVGGARRAARIATKRWTDADILDFIDVKKGGFLWSANNSVSVDEKFWQQKTKHSQKVLDAILKASYHHNTGEPGFINQHRLVQNDTGYGGYLNGKYAQSKKYTPGKRTVRYLAAIAKKASSKLYTQIPNPCGEISLNMLGGYCVIGDVVPYFAPDLDAAEDSFRAMVRALVRVNLMDSLYNREVARTNRIGVGMTGLHEFAWNYFGFGFKDLIDEEKSQEFWNTLARFKRAVVDEAKTYSKQLGINTPHTNTTIKPAGCLVKDSVIITRNGILSLEEIGDVNGSTWQDHNISVPTYSGTRNSKKFYVNGLSATKKITLDSGIILESTRDHKFKVLRGNNTVWTEAKNIKLEDKIPYIIGGYDDSYGENQKLNKISSQENKYAYWQKQILQPSILTEELAWFIGLYFGDGSNHKRSIRIHGNVDNLSNLNKAKQIIKNIFGIDGKISVPKREGKRAELSINSTQIKKFLQENSLLKKHSKSIEIPLLIRKSPKTIIEAFVEGYYAADGCDKNPSGKTSCTTSEKFARQLVVLLRAIGRDAKLRLMPATSTSKGASMRYWVSERKGRKANDRYVKKDLKESWRKLDELGFNNYGVDSVVKIEDAVNETFDIEVDLVHSYFANSYISHNTTSKLFGLSEGAHLPAMREYIRWVQFRNDDPLVKTYKRKKYPWKELKSYSGTTVIGFPTQPEICQLGMNGELVTAGEATMDDQYKWLELLEKYWIVGIDESGNPLPDTGNQVSYTLKYKKDKVSFDKYRKMVTKFQSKVKCCSVMPQQNETAYEYSPEEAVTVSEFAKILTEIERDDDLVEDIDIDQLKCESGACPI